jgi:hypothetical protein
MSADPMIRALIDTAMAPGPAGSLEDLYANWSPLLDTGAHSRSRTLGLWFAKPLWNGVPPAHRQVLVCHPSDGAVATALDGRTEVGGQQRGGESVIVDWLAYHVWLQVAHLTLPAQNHVLDQLAVTDWWLPVQKREVAAIAQVIQPPLPPNPTMEQRARHVSPVPWLCLAGCTTANATRWLTLAVAKAKHAKGPGAPLDAVS